jgi:uncharacterized membrane protein YdjX (TVP38/TMEM64 family)
VRWLLVGLALAGAVLLVQQVPAERLVTSLTGRVQELGAWGVVLFGVAYVLAAVLLLPASAFTIAAGALFGLVKGTIIVSISATIGAALGFLLGRYAARERVARRAARSRTFAAIDRAIAIGGWKVVALLRLSPAMPFSIGNYLFGLTAVRFWPYVAATAVATLPGIFMYIYLGYVGGQLATGAASAASGGRWALLGLGLVATVAATLYVTRLARRALHEQRIDGE